MPSTGPRSTPSRRDTAAPTFDNTVAALERSGRLLSRVSSVFYVLAGAHTNEALAGNRARHGAEALAPLERDLSERRAVRPARRRSSTRLLGWVSQPEQARVLERYHSLFRRAGAGPRCRRQGAAEGDRRRGWPRWGPRSARTCWPTSRPTLMLDGEDDLAGLPDFVARGGARRRGGARAARASTSSRSAARASSRSCSSPPAATCARRRSAPGSRAATTPARPTTRPVIAETDGAARRAGAAARLRELRALQARRHHGQDAGRPCIGLLDAVWAPAQRRVIAERDALQELVTRRGRQLRARALGLALLRREAAQGALRSRRERDQALLAARRHHRGGVLHRDAPVRPHLRAAHGRAGLSPRRARLGCDRRRRPPRRPVLRRLLRAALQAQRRLDDDAARPGEARRRGPPADPQRDELQQGRGRRADAALVRRRPHAVPRVRPRPARADVGRDLSDDLRHRRAAGLRRTALAALRALARAARKSSQRFARHYKTGEPMPRGADGPAARRRAPSIRAS